MKLPQIMVLALLLALVALAAAPVFAQKADAEAGKALFAKKCATCHGPTGDGKDEIKKMFNVPMPALGSKEVQAHTDVELKKIIHDGKGKMKAAADLSDQDIANIVAHMRTLAHK